MEKTKHKEDIQNPTWYEQTLQYLQNNCSHQDCRARKAVKAQIQAVLGELE
jgi:hypothetical protein